MLVLQTLAAGPSHGYGVAERLRECSREVLVVEEGSLYPALHRLAKRGWVKSSWGRSDNNRRARFYELTARGRKQLKREVETWRRMAEAITRVVGPAPGRGLTGELS